MKIELIRPQPPPKEIQMTFTRDEGWTILMALGDAIKRYPGADGVEKWKQWAKDLDLVLRR